MFKFPICMRFLKYFILSKGPNVYLLDRSEWFLSFFFSLLPCERLPWNQALCPVEVYTILILLVESLWSHLTCFCVLSISCKLAVKSQSSITFRFNLFWRDCFVNGGVFLHQEACTAWLFLISSSHWCLMSRSINPLGIAKWIFWLYHSSFLY